MVFLATLREAAKYYLADFFPWEVALPPLFFAKKISGIGGSPPITESPQILSGKKSPKRA